MELEEQKFEFFDWEEDQTECVLLWLEGLKVITDYEVYVDTDGIVSGYFIFTEICSEVIETLAEHWGFIEDVTFDPETGELDIKWGRTIQLTLE